MWLEAQDIDRLDTGRRVAVVVQSPDDSTRKMIVSDGVGEVVVLGFPGEVLGFGEVVHRPAGIVIKRDRMAVSPVKVFDPEFDLMQGLQLSLVEVVGLGQWLRHRTSEQLSKGS